MAGEQTDNAPERERKAPPEAATKDSASKDAEPADDSGNAGEEEKHGVDRIIEELSNAAKLAAEVRSLDSASRIFGLQTNQQFNVFGGMAAEREQRIQPISPGTLARVRRGFVFGADYRLLRFRVLDDGLVIVTGEAGWGRMHLSLHILDALCDGRVNVVDGGSLVDLVLDDLEERAGYVWTNPVGGGSGATDVLRVERLAERLRERQSCMIIIWPEGTGWPAELDEFRFSLSGPPDLSAVARAHIGSPAGRRAEDLLADRELTGAVAALREAGEAARLGRAVRDAVRHGRPLSDALPKVEDAAEWFGRLPSHEDQVFALSLATLDRLSFPTVVAGARRLDELIQRAEDAEGRVSLRTRICPSRQLLAEVEAVTEPGEVDSEYGCVPVLQVRSRRSDFSKRMVTGLWRGFPYLQEIFLDWLTGLVSDEDPNVRSRAAVVVGILAQEDFDFLRSRVLQVWACSERPKVQRAAAVALRAPALSVELRELVWRLLDDWAAVENQGSSRKHLYRVTAAMALGAPVGATDYSRALKLIADRLLDHEPGQYSYRLWQALMTAVAELFDDGGSPQSETVLDHMHDWAEKRDVAGRTVATSALLGILSRPPMASPRDTRRLPPALRVVDQDPKNALLLGELTRSALNTPQLEAATLGSIRRLAENAEEIGDEVLLREIVVALPETARDRRTLRREIRGWTSGERNSPIFDRLLGWLTD